MKLLRKVEMESESFQIGDVIAFSLKTGEDVEAMAVEKTDKGTVFCLVDCLKKEYPLHKDKVYPGYENSTLRKVLNEKIIKTFPDDIVAKMIPFDNGDLLRIPTEKQMFGCNDYGEDEDDEVQQWEPMKNRRNRIAFQGSKSGVWEWYWLENKSNYSATYAAFVNTNGLASILGSAGAYGVRPRFLLVG